jgi:hypothetical protein
MMALVTCEECFEVVGNPDQYLTHKAKEHRNTQEVERQAGEFLALTSNIKDGFDGLALGLVNDIFKLNGEDYTDGECLDLILKVSAHWCNLTGGSAWVIA